MHPDLIRVIIRALEISTIDFTVLEGVRSLDRQKVLYKQGATKTMRSRHLSGHAVDLAPLIDIDGDGKLDVSWHWPHYHTLAKAVKEAAEIEGVSLEWGGDWTSFKDGPHWQLPWKGYP